MSETLNLVLRLLFRSPFAVLVVGLLASAAGAMELREWTDRSGQFTVRAELVGQDATSAFLRTDDGRELTIAWSKLSAADQRFKQTPTTNGAASRGIRFAKPGRYTVRLGARVTAGTSPFSNLVCTFPIPKPWPEQKVTILERDLSPNIQQTNTRSIADGVEQFEFRVPRLAAGEEAHAVLTFEVERYQIEAPADPSVFRFAKQPDRSLRAFLQESPYIEIGNRQVKQAAQSLELNTDASAWKQVEQIYDWTWEKVASSGTRPLQGALGALQNGSGDCEERTCLFIAMCRLKGIPARSVWVDGHTYPEFYLVDDQEQGHWIPCESIGGKFFGSMPDYKLILQKGDNFHMSQKKGRQRYVTPTLSGSHDPRGTPPTLREVREYPQGTEQATR